MTDKETTAAKAPNRCDVDAISSEKPEPTVLTMFAAPMETADYIARTARYARDPKGYLESALGSDFEARKDLLSLPEKVDRDAYGTGTHKSHFEAHIAKLMGKPHGLFFITGVQAQLAAMKIHCDRAGKQRAAWHVTSHLEEAELSAWSELYGLDRTLMGARKDALPTVEEIKAVLSLPEEERPAVLLIEVPNRTLGCATYSFEDLETLSKACKEANVKFHCDGARQALYQPENAQVLTGDRLWEIEPFYRHTANKCFTEICALFDTAYVSFYKGLAGVTGAMLLCPDELFLKDAKTWQRRAGGNAMTLMYEVIDCERGFNENIGTFDRKWRKMQEVVASIKAATEEFRTKGGKPVVKFVVDPPTCCQSRVVFSGFTGDELDAARDTAQEKTNVRIYNRLWGTQSLDEKMKAEGKEAEGEGSSDGSGADESSRVIEWMMMSVTEKVETQKFVDGNVAFCEALCKP